MPRVQAKSRLSIEIPAQLHKQLKTMAALNGLSVKDLVLSCLSDHLLSSNIPNKETLAAMEATDRGEGLITCKDIGDLFEKLGLNKCPRKSPTATASKKTSTSKKGAAKTSKK